MAESITENGYTLRFRVRMLKSRRRQNGRARGFYEGKYVYARVTGPDGFVRDIYLGTETETKRPTIKPRVGKIAAGHQLEQLAGGKSKGRNGGQEEPIRTHDARRLSAGWPASAHNGRSANRKKG